MMSRPFRSSIFVAIGALVFMTVAAGVAAYFGHRPSAAAEPWPPFQMTYRIQGGNQDGQIWRLVYKSKHEWRQDLLADRHDSTNVGSWQSFSGTTHSTYDASVGATESEDIPVGTGYSPNQWLVPRSLSALEARGYSMIRKDPDGSVVLERAQTIACPAGATDLAGPIAVACSVAGATSYETREQLTVDHNTVPLRDVSLVNGTTVGAFEASTAPSPTSPSGEAIGLDAAPRSEVNPDG